MLIEDCLLIRLPVTPGSWAEDIPPVPDGFQATLVFGHLDDAINHAETMGELGYTVAGVGIDHAGAPADDPFADIMIERRLANAYPRWRDGLMHHGAKVYDLSMGPVQRVFAAAIAAHTPQWGGNHRLRQHHIPVYLRPLT
ncbi:hypothetical protein [Stomatohabitans albus]|uniref:hypothetical protein n=1 Tax=Stomatohabitans albus TaxID=3110766 RepID=UPI00300D5111